ncbi:discoidin domain-containing protein [Bacteroides acidifaciens]|uniref:discoidin domain-containing protein n=1 Tax=Bacteroides acidifaciens TaxID=85831 RepID=UPI00259A11FC|nr:discoidin domain-containing protein [Bacteroides acidifaciens]
MKFLSKLIEFVLYSVMFIRCTPCIPSNEALTNVILEKSGDNRRQLEQVIGHYTNIDADSQKLEAAYYLIANMEDKVGYVASDSIQYHLLLDSLAVLSDPIGWDPYLSTTGKWLDSTNMTSPLRIGVRIDLKHITADYLIRNIDQAFKQWQHAPWAKDYSFQEFCEWVLPYRTGYERLETWRNTALAIPCPGADSLRRLHDSWGLGLALINHTGIYYNIGMGRFPLPMTFSDMTTVKRGGCDQMADYALKLFRSHGIPSALDMTPTWANRRSGHVWNVLVLPGGHSREIGYNPNGENRFVYKLSKIYRQRFSPMREGVLYRLHKTESVPNFFQDYRMEDVTGQYDMPVSDVVVNDLRRSDRQVAWLCTFDNSKWVPVAYAEVEGRKAMFRNMARGVLPGDNEPIAYINDGKGIVYLPAYYENKHAISAAAPRILHEDGTIEVLTIDTVHRQTLTLNRKYPKHPHFDEYEKGMIGGRFEGANQSNFSDAVTLLTIERQQAYPMEQLMVSNLKVAQHYRYVRYVSPSGYWGNVAEIEFWDSENRLDGKVLGVAGEVIARGPTAVFDGNLESFYYAKDTTSFWVGLDLGKPQQIKKIAFAARTDDNEIRVGDTYQLYYWHDGWQALPSVVAEEHLLTWDHVPSNTLYLLRNLSRGVEQRPFTYENGTQVWW